jgi:uncharacterized protein (TIGR02646 family)
MVSVKKDFDNPPSGLITENCKKRIKLSLEEKNAHNFSCYNDSKKTVLNKLKDEIYHNKCGYCETKINAGFELQIEHYRPKKEVEEDLNHDGYYWLGYEWSNLLLACPKCNQQGAKGNKFPIEGKRVYTHSYCIIDGLLASKECYPPIFLKEEKPLLLNPEVDEVEKYLFFLPTGEIRGLENRGKKTIEICNLDRDSLIIARKKIVDDILIEIRKDIDFFIQKKISDETLTYNLKKIFSNILRRMDKEKGYSRVYYFIFAKFNIFILNKLGDKQKELVKKKFNEFKKGKK